MNRKADVVIIGGGITGCCLAYLLSKKGLDVTVVEKRYLASGATGACGAGIRQQWSTRENALLAIQSVKIFERLSSELGQDIEFRQGGYLIAIHTDNEMEQAERNVAMQRSLGLKVDILEPERLTDVVPILDVKGMKAIGATFCPTDGHANPFKTTFAYADAARKLGATILTHTSVVNLKTTQKAVSGVVTNQGTIRTPVVVNAAGVDAKAIAEMVHIHLPITPFRKEIMATERLEPLFDAMVISFTDGIYFSQQKEGQIVGGIPIPEEHSGFLSTPTFEFLSHMSRTLTRYAPVLRHVNMLRHWTGFYDVTPDARPLLGPVKGPQGFIQCSGFSGHGFMISPMVCQLLAGFIADNKTSEVLETLNLSRFKGKTTDRELSVVG
ncbi:MAG: FAD-binding oxidoreductase [Candidatus Thermoplasmatota archaeon]|nr:FAD-binding oxidoreductase [Candidatus Thermoplasmatota archaeon]